jgi:hypothetical protein
VSLNTPGGRSCRYDTTGAGGNAGGVDEDGKDDDDDDDVGGVDEDVVNVDGVRTTSRDDVRRFNA